MSVEMESLQLTLEVGVDSDDAIRERMKYSLIREVRNIPGVESVEEVKAAITPKGARGDALTIGALVLAIAPVVIPKLVEFLQSWTNRGEGRTVKVKAQIGDTMVELEFSPKDMSPDEMTSIVNKLTKLIVRQNK